MRARRPLNADVRPYSAILPVSMIAKTTAGTVTVKVGMATVQIGPIGSALYALEFLEAANAVPQQSTAKGSPEFSPVRYYLCCRALELSLKAFLLTKGQTAKELKDKLGHDLEKLWVEANSRGLGQIVGGLSPQFEADLKDANHYYKGKAFEYFDFTKWAHGYKGLPELGRFKGACSALVPAVKDHCFSVC